MIRTVVVDEPEMARLGGYFIGSMHVLYLLVSLIHV